MAGRPGHTSSLVEHPHPRREGPGHHSSALHYSGEDPCARPAALKTAQVPPRRAAARPWDEAPRPEPCPLTDGCEEEPGLVDGAVSLRLIVADRDLGGEGVRREGEKSRDHLSQAGNATVTAFPAFHPTARQASFFQTSEPSPPGSTPGLAGCFPQIIKLERGFSFPQSASRVLTAHLCPRVYPAACGAPHLQPGAGLRLFPLEKALPHHCHGAPEVHN